MAFLTFFILPSLESLSRDGGHQRGGRRHQRDRGTRPSSQDRKFSSGWVQRWTGVQNKFRRN